jgi:hypothetical protein
MAENDTSAAKMLIARIKIITGEIEMQNCRIDQYIDQLSAERLKGIEEPTDNQIEESKKWQD